MVMSSKPKAIDEIFFLPQRVQIVLTFMTVLVVAFCLGLPVAFLGLVLEMELVQHFLRRLDGRLYWYYKVKKSEKGAVVGFWWIAPPNAQVRVLRNMSEAMQHPMSQKKLAVCQIE